MTTTTNLEFTIRCIPLKTILKLMSLKDRFVRWSEWGNEYHQKFEDSYFSFYDIFCCSMILYPASFAAALFFHLVQAGVYA